MGFENSLYGAVRAAVKKKTLFWSTPGKASNLNFLKIIMKFDMNVLRAANEKQRSSSRNE